MKLVNSLEFQVGEFKFVVFLNFVYFPLQSPYFCLIIDTSHFGTALFSSDGYYLNENPFCV